MNFPTLVRGQARVLMQSRRLTFLFGLYVAVWLIFAAVLRLSGWSGPWPLDLAVGGLGSAITSCIAFFWGGMLWRDEGPRTRQYHWSLPVDPAVHDLARVAAGGLWLLAGITLYLVIGLVLCLGHDVSLSSLMLVTPFAWIGFYTGGLLAFAAGASIAVAFDRPLEWVVGIALTLMIVYIVTEAAAIDDVALFLFDGDLGIGSATYGAADVGILNVFHLTQSLRPWALATGVWAVVTTVMMMTALVFNRGRVRT